MFDALKDSELAGCLKFLIEIDGLKKVLRKTKIIGEERNENTAEHSWHLIMMALVLQRYALQPVDITRVIKMLAIHDLGEIEAGDIFLYNTDSRLEAENHEKQALLEMMKSLPESLQNEFIILWDEFTKGQTADSRYARALDRFQPFLSNIANQGGTWKTMEVTRAMALDKNRHIAEGSAILWQCYQTLAEEAGNMNYFHSPERSA